MTGVGVMPELVWGWVARGIAFVFLIAFASLFRQIVPIAGRRGVAPVCELMTAMERDFSLGRRLLYFPSLLWFDRSDAALRALVVVGTGAAAWALYGGPYSPWAFAICYVTYLSLDRAVVLVYPWDSLLLEAGFWAMFLPPLAALPDSGLIAAPAPALAWVYRLLMFRLMFGFGKQKFMGSRASDWGFLKGFYIRQPLPTPLGWFAHHLPMPVHKFSLLVMFLIEVPLSFGWLVPGPWSVLAACSTAALMLVIASSGNYGYFNWLSGALDVPERWPRFELTRDAEIRRTSSELDSSRQ